MFNKNIFNINYWYIDNINEIISKQCLKMLKENDPQKIKCNLCMCVCVCVCVCTRVCVREKKERKKERKIFWIVIASRKVDANNDNDERVYLRET